MKVDLDPSSPLIRIVSAPITKNEIQLRATEAVLASFQQVNQLKRKLDDVIDQKSPKKNQSITSQSVQAIKDTLTQSAKRVSQSIDNSLSRTIDSLNALTSGSKLTKPSTTLSINQSTNQKERETKISSSSIHGFDRQI